MATLQEQITNAVDDFKADRDIMHQIVHGDFSTVVSTEGGNVKSLAKAIKDLEDTYTATGILVQVQNYRADAFGWAENAEDIPFTDSQGVTGHSAKHWAAKSAGYANDAQDWVLEVGLPEVDVITSDLTIDASNMADYKGHLLVCDASAGDIVISVAAISVLGEPYSFRFKKTDDSSNTVTFQHAAGDTTEGGTDPIILSVKGAGYRVDTDADPEPDNWSAVAFGSSANMREEIYHFDATAGQTVFTGADKFGKTLAYEVGHVEVVRGFAEIWAAEGDFTAADGVSVVLSNEYPLIDGEQIIIRARSTFAVSDGYSQAEVNALLAAIPNGEIGSIQFFGRKTPPTGWLPLDGTAHLISTIPDLDDVAYCGDADNATAEAFYRCTDPGDPENTRDIAGDYLYLPDVTRDGGSFLRALAAGRELGSWQDAGFEEHSHGLGELTTAAAGTAVNVYAAISPFSATSQETGVVETRPVNHAFPVYIKAFHAVPVPTPGPQGVNKAGDDMAGYLGVPAGVLPGHAVNKGQLDALRNYAYVENAGYESTTNSWPDTSSPVTITNGKECLSATFTPTRVGAVIEISAVVHVSVSAAGWVIAALFKDSGPDTIFASSARDPVYGGAGKVLHIHARHVASNTDEITFSVRYGGVAGATAYLNGSNTAAKFGMKSSMSIREVA